ncbi:MAG: hypothetical protein EBR72_00955 [Bacteroidetes bacterium]|nr:hypothetical protein [Bacteroidota bacterium]
MNIDQKTYELINSYLSGELKGRKLDAFKARLKKEEDLRNKLELQQAIIDGIKEVRTQELKDFINKNIAKEKKKQSPVFKTGLSIAASIGIILIIFFSIKPFIIKESTFGHSKDSTDNSNPIVKLNEQEHNDNIVHIDSIIPEKKSIDTQLIAKVPSLEQVLVEKELSDNEALEDEINTETNEIEDEMVSDDEDIEIADYSMEQSISTIDTVINNAKSTTGNTLSITSDEIRNDSIIRKDQLLATSYISIRLLSNTEERDNIKTSSNIVNELTDNSVVQRSKTDKKIRTKKSTIQVEYWESVVGFNGYKYDGNTLQLYGITPNENIALSSLDKRLYLKKGNQYYSIAKSNTTHKFAPITNPIMLKVLNE